MKAAVVHAPGQEHVVITEVPDPTVGPGTVKVRMRAAALNRADLNIKDGKFPEAPYPIVLGVEGAGEIVDIANDVTGFDKGDRVVINPMVVCGDCENCRAGADTECPSLRVVGEHFDGTYADYIVLPARNLIKAPDHMSFTELAASVVPYLTAWHMLITRGGLSAGETVLVVGAGSGVGSAAVQVAASLGARVIATTSTPEKEARVRALGAAEVVNYRQFPDFDEAVKELTGGRGADLVHETVGRATVQKSIQSVRQGGRVVGMGSHTGRFAEVDLWKLYRREATFIGCHLWNRKEIAEFLPLLSGGQITPLIDSVFELDDIVSAHARLIEDDRFGKVVVTI